MLRLTHWGRATHMCVSKLTIIGSDNGLSPGRRQAIIWTNAGILLIGPLGTNRNEILIEIQTFSLKKIRLKMSSAKCCSFRLGLNVLTLIHVSNRGTRKYPSVLVTILIQDTLEMPQVNAVINMMLLYESARRLAILKKQSNSVQREWHTKDPKVAHT